MENNIAYCGEDCSLCPAYIATKNDDDALRRDVVEQWSHIGDFSKYIIDCLGCKSAGPILEPCSKCNIKKCCSDKELDDCSYCLNIDSCSQMSTSSREATYQRIIKMREGRK